MFAVYKVLNFISFLAVAFAFANPITMHQDAQAFNEYVSAAVDLTNAHVDPTGLFTSMYLRTVASGVGWKVD
jgi:hypothetical protein